MRLPLFALAAATAVTAFAQTVAAPLVQESQPQDPRKNQKVQRIHIEDAGAKIDEVRVGGETQSITVKPATMPEYEIQPSDMARTRPGDNRDGLSNANGRRVWNLFQF